MKQQTAVEWLFKHIEGIRIIDGYEFIKLQEAFEKAKAMEKEQIKNAWDNGYLDYSILMHEDAEQYYNEKYGNQN